MNSFEANPLHRPPSELQTAALGCLERGGTVVTGNARAARWMQRRHAEAQQAAGKLAWPTPAIYDWGGWLSFLWKQYIETASDAPLVLSSLQEQAVWKKIVRNSGADSESVARLCSNAWKLLSDYNVHDQRWWPWTGKASADAEAFREWAGLFDRECQKRHWTSRSDLPQLLTAQFRENILTSPAQILCVGFDRITPAQQSLIDAARSTGAAVTVFEIPTGETPDGEKTSQLIEANNLQDELTTCAWWARRKLEENPAAGIAVIVQAVDQVRGEIERTFREVLMPRSVGIESNAAMPFEFSLGKPLATVPLIRAALLTLRWLVEPLEESAVSWLAISGFLARDGDNLDEMAVFNAELRERGHLAHQVHIDNVFNYRPRLNSRTVARFLKRLRGLDSTAQAEGIGVRTKTFPEWMDTAEKLLKKARWPGSRTLESAEYQARARWERMTADIAALGFDGARAGWGEFVTALDRYVAETIFAPESLGCPIQIMGALESSGQEFDALWFLSADENQWPATGRPDPLLPLWLQRKAAMPHSTIEEDWARNLAITRRFAASAPECVFSYALRNETGELRPSALLAEAFGPALSETSSDELRATLNVPMMLPHKCLTHEIDDRSQIPWPRQISAGGAEILKRQSACAFQSFATRRLGIKELEDADRGLNPLDRGNALHAVLQAFWSKENSAALPMRNRSDLFNAKAAGKLAQILDHHIAVVFKERFAGARGKWWDAYLRVEQSRLHSVLLQWLDYELGRPDFIVEACEKEQTVKIDGLELHLRVDRIDRVDKGRLILDYKTGVASASMWEGERPDEPQLPLYGTHGGVEDLCGVLFAKIRAEEMHFVGSAKDPATTVYRNFSGRTKVKSNLTEDALRQWSETLRILAADFLTGNAAVEPKSYPKTCRFCPLPGLCRVAEVNVATEAEDDADDSAITGEETDNA